MTAILIICLCHCAATTAHIPPLLPRRCFSQARRDYVRTARELQNMLLMLHTRSRAATTIQATWRGHRERKVFAPVWQEHCRDKAARTLQRVRPALLLWRSHAVEQLSAVRLGRVAGEQGWGYTHPHMCTCSLYSTRGGWCCLSALPVL